MKSFDPKYAINKLYFRDNLMLIFTLMCWESIKSIFRTLNYILLWMFYRRFTLFLRKTHHLPLWFCPFFLNGRSKCMLFCSEVFFGMFQISLLKMWSVNFPLFLCNRIIFYIIKWSLSYTFTRISNSLVPVLTVFFSYFI